MAPEYDSVFDRRTIKAHLVGQLKGTLPFGLFDHGLPC